MLGNKIDMPTAASEAELRSSLGLVETTGKDAGAAARGGAGTRDTGVRPVEMFMCSILKKSGYGEGIKWLTGYL